MAAAVVAAAVLPATHAIALDNDPTTGTDPNATYVAVGDSYGAGAGIFPTQLAGENHGVGCARNYYNYPKVLAHKMGWTLNDATCSAATIKNAWSVKQYGSIDPQKSRITDKTKYVTFQFGGNDSTLAITVKNCALDALGARRTMPGYKPLPSSPEKTPCKDAVESGEWTDMSNNLVNYFHLDLDTMRTNLNTALQDIHAIAPEAKVAIVGYPAVIPEDVTECRKPGNSNLGGIKDGDLVYFRAKFQEVNAAIAQVAENHSGYATFVDTYAPFKGHEACKSWPKGQNDVQEGAWVAGIPATVPGVEQKIWAAAHPNQLGHRKIAQLIADAWSAKK
ncbi:SGNH/GDSL hydrolase family protein [Streptomyces sp. NPDC001941]|uniref:SGNH/GDSL hydrolase family protein n=1 Tax=Streptomyces sp. NPDC001941 TaxID=3154659 RepID=UPI003334A3A4